MTDAEHVLACVSPQYAFEPSLHAIVNAAQRLVFRLARVGVEVPINALECSERLALPRGADLLEVGIDANSSQLRMGLERRLRCPSRAQHRTAVNRRKPPWSQELSNGLCLASSLGRQPHPRQPPVQHIFGIVRFAMTREPDRRPRQTISE